MQSPKPRRHRLNYNSIDIKKAAGNRKDNRLLQAPSKDETAKMPAFQGLSLDQIHIPKSLDECQNAFDKILAAAVAGFDTETKPIFRKGQQCTGPHLMQIALADEAFIFQLHRMECQDTLSRIITSKQILKVGFGLKNDTTQIRRRFNIDLQSTLDLDHLFREFGYRGQIGVRGAMGAVLQQYFKKSKSITTSNWALEKLSSRQIIYAANDAFAALKILHKLQDDGQLES